MNKQHITHTNNFNYGKQCVTVANGKHAFLPLRAPPPPQLLLKRSSKCVY